MHRKAVKRRTLSSIAREGTSWVFSRDSRSTELGRLTWIFTVESPRAVPLTREEAIEKVGIVVQ